MLAALSLTWVAAASPGGTTGGSRGGGGPAATTTTTPTTATPEASRLWAACRGRLEADGDLLAGRLPPGVGCAALPGAVQEQWDAYYAPGVLENASSLDAAAYRRLLLGRFMALHPVRSWIETGPFTPADLDVVHNHWLGFPPQRPAVHYTLAAAYTLIMTLGVFGNLLVLYMFCRYQSRAFDESRVESRLVQQVSDKTGVSQEGNIHLELRLGFQFF